MAAADEFPRGLNLANNGSPASVTFPAVPGIAWVLAGIDAIAFSLDTTSQHVVQVGPTVGLTNHTIGGYLCLSAVSSATLAVVKDEWTWTGEAQATLGSALTVSFDTIGPNMTEALNVYAFPI